MQNKMIKIFIIISVIFPISVIADVNVNADKYDPSGSMFEKITDMEQKKVLWQLEKENAQMQLDMDRMKAERARIKNEIESIKGAEAAQIQAIELERQRLDLEKQKLEAQKYNINQMQVSNDNSAGIEKESLDIQEKYRLIEIIGAGRQLIATIEDNKTGQRKKISVGKELDGYTIDGISLDEGIVLSKDGEKQTIGVNFSQ